MTFGFLLLLFFSEILSFSYHYGRSRTVRLLRFPAVKKLSLFNYLFVCLFFVWTLACFHPLFEILSDVLLRSLLQPSLLVAGEAGFT